MSGEAMQMRLQLASLAKRHNVSIEPQRTMPLSSPVDYAVDLSGLAATADIDLTRQKFKAYAFTNLCLLLSRYPKPPLYYRHDESETVGEIAQLKYDDRGNLRICAQTDHPLAKRCNAFSIGAKILDFEIVGADSKDFHALITSAEITEISLTDRPANPHAVVQSRSRTAPVELFLKTLREQADLMIQRVRLVQRGFEIIAQLAQSEAAPPANVAPRPKAARPTLLRPTPRRPTQFQQLVQELSNR